MKLKQLLSIILELSFKKIEFLRLFFRELQEQTKIGHFIILFFVGLDPAGSYVAPNKTLTVVK